MRIEVRREHEWNDSSLSSYYNKYTSWWNSSDKNQNELFISIPALVM